MEIKTIKKNKVKIKNKIKNEFTEFEKIAFIASVNLKIRCQNGIRDCIREILSF